MHLFEGKEKFIFSEVMREVSIHRLIDSRFDFKEEIHKAFVCIGREESLKVIHNMGV